MLAFTKRHSGGSIDAVYTGRFAFVPGLEEDRARQLLNPAIQNDRSAVACALHEEIRHSRLFLYTYTGLTLEGFRLLVRLAWLVPRSRWAVDRYYRFRTIFYMISYTLHEEAAGLLKLSAGPVETEQILATFRRSLMRIEMHVWRCWLLHSGAPLTALLLAVFSPVFQFIGWMLARNFAVFTLQRSPTEPSVLLGYPVARRGALNSLSPHSASIPEKLLLAVRFEGYVPNTGIMDLEWARCKFKAEREQWHRLLGYLQAHHLATDWHRSYGERAAEAVEFAARWAGVPDAATMCEFVNCLTSDQPIRFSAMERDAAGPARAMCNFFYLHGN